MKTSASKTSLQMSMLMLSDPVCRHGSIPDAHVESGNHTMNTRLLGLNGGYGAHAPARQALPRPSERDVLTLLLDRMLHGYPGAAPENPDHPRVQVPNNGVAYPLTVPGDTSMQQYLLDEGAGGSHTAVPALYHQEGQGYPWIPWKRDMLGM